MFQHVSVQKSLAIAASSLISYFLLSAICETSHVTASIAKTEAAMEEIFEAIASCSPIEHPHCFLSFPHRRATDRHHLLAPVTVAGRVNLPVLSVINANLSPCPSPKMIFSFGTFTFLKLIKPF